MGAILYYITGHGYGHAVRSGRILRSLIDIAPHLTIHVRTTAPEWLFSGDSRQIAYSRQALDVGVIQADSLRMDLAATLRSCCDLHRRLPELIAGEAEFAKARKIDLILADVPPAAFAVGARAGIASVAVTNFTWDVIYRDYVDEYGGFLSLIDEIRSFYRNASLALALPYSCDLSVFPKTEPIPWITRRSGLTKDQARIAFGLPTSAVVVLLSFGGLGLEALPVERLNALTDFFFVTTGPVVGKWGNLLVLDGVQRRYEDLVRAADVVVTKPGYGIVADALAHQVRVLYTDRGQFAEYPFLVQALSELATAEFLPKESFLAGDIGPYLRKLMSKPPNWPAVALNGSERAAERILNLLQ